MMTVCLIKRKMVEYDAEQQIAFLTEQEVFRGTGRELTERLLTLQEACEGEISGDVLEDNKESLRELMSPREFKCYEEMLSTVGTEEHYLAEVVK